MNAIRDYEIMEKSCARFINQWFNKNIKPKIISAMKREGIKRIQEMNNYIFFELNDGTTVIDSDFNERQDKFYIKYLTPALDHYHTAYKVHLDISI